MAHLVYKCRSCGMVFEPFGVPDALQAMLSVVYKLPFPEEWGGSVPRMVELHFCSPNEIGAADLQGAKQT